MLKCFVRVVFLIAVALAVSACQAPQARPSYRTTVLAKAGASIDVKAANVRGITLAEEGLMDEAERAFREALASDVSYAAAHNNLGLVLMQRGHYYEAALEFSYAGKLDERAVEPLINLGRLYETVGWHKAAHEEYEKAREHATKSVWTAEILVRSKTPHMDESDRSQEDLEDKGEPE